MNNRLHLFIHGIKQRATSARAVNSQLLDAATADELSDLIARERFRRRPRHQGPDLPAINQHYRKTSPITAAQQENLAKPPELPNAHGKEVQ